LQNIISTQKEFKEEFRGIQSVLVNTKKKPANMTSAKALAAGRAVQNQKTVTAQQQEAKIQPFKSTSPFQDFFGEHWNMINKLIFDPGHQFGNLGIDLLALINNKDKMKWNEKRKANHKKFKRFEVHGY
jgi:hypothetical protein